MNDSEFTKLVRITGEVCKVKMKKLQFIVETLPWNKILIFIWKCSFQISLCGDYFEGFISECRYIFGGFLCQKKKKNYMEIFFCLCWKLQFLLSFLYKYEVKSKWIINTFLSYICWYTESMKFCSMGSYKNSFY